MKNRSGRILVAGIYLSSEANNIEHIVAEFNSSHHWETVQKWIGIGSDPVSKEVKNVTSATLREGVPKFILLNRILGQEDLDGYEYVLISDDDIALPGGFLDSYLDFVGIYDFALAQPARTHNSYIDHPFVEQLDGLDARRTRFVEIGPFVSIRHDAYKVLLPFDEGAHMGWGFDFVWPSLVEQHGLRMGIIDATPVEHSMRKPVKNYQYDDANRSMKEFLARKHGLSKDEAFRIIESYT
jgi:hypothetical protein